MPKSQKKTGKGRLDKYYKLAKEQGYRARSAFKLIQLNKKFAFLETSRCIIDLCAAPGGWLQVASKYMPANSIIVGVDLVPIKPIPHVITFASDITTPQCRNLIRSAVKDWKADVVLHDGAPNVGTAWVQDAYSQSELVLMSLKLAVQFLVKGGVFVTKVFRSADYNNLLWVFNQLFGKVEATKPPSSRNVSAEIFVVCRDFLAPKHIDPKFLDPAHVFKDISASEPSVNKDPSAVHAQANVFHPEKKRRQRDGYADGDYTLFKTISARDFVRGGDPVALLGTANKIVFGTEEEREWLNLHVTSEDVKANCNDLKVLGKGDFKTLLKWRLALREEASLKQTPPVSNTLLTTLPPQFGLDNKVKTTEELTETVEITEELHEEQQISEELERLNAEVAARTKRERRRANEIKARTIQRMQLQMTAPLDIGLEQQDAALVLGQDDVFDLVRAEDALRKGEIDEDDEGDDHETEENGSESDVVLDSDQERERKVMGLEAELDGLYDAYQNRLRERDAKYKIMEARRKNTEREEWHGIQEEQDDDGESSVGGWDEKDGSDLSSDESDSDGETFLSKARKRSYKEGDTSHSSKRPRLVTKLEGPKIPVSKAAQLWFSQDVFAGIDGADVISDNEDGDEDEHEKDSDDDDMSVDEHSRLSHSEAAATSEDDDDFRVVAQGQEDRSLWSIGNDTNEIREGGLDTPELVTLAQQLVNRQTTKTQLINDGFNRYSLNSKEGLPLWFLDDESKFYKPNLPITKEAVAALREKQRALDARPIKKVAEAKARKKFKAQQRLEKAMKKAEGVNATSDMSEREKAQQIEKLMRKGMASGHKKKKEVKVVVAKGIHKGIKGRPKGVKGRYTMVDSRMRKELRSKRRKEKANKKRTRT